MRILRALLSVVRTSVVGRRALRTFPNGKEMLRRRDVLRNVFPWYLFNTWDNMSA